MVRAGIGVVTVGARLSTVTAKLCSAARPSGSVTVTVTTASPCDRAVTTNVPSLPERSSATTPPSEASASQVSGSSSGSLKYAASATVSASPLKTVRAGMVSVATGPRLGTVTAKLCSAVRPSGSVTVTMTTASPFDRAVTTSVPSLPERSSATTPASDPSASQVSGSPSGSEK